MSTRRTFLTGLAATLAAGTFLSTRSAGAGPLQGLSIGGQGGAAGPYKVLEIMLKGGLSHRETLAVNGSASVWHGLQSINWSSIGGSAAYKPPSSSWLWAFSGNHLLGPALYPFHNSALASRMCQILVAHDLDPHDPARVMVLTGLPVGRTRRAGLGAVVARAVAQGLLPGASQGLPPAYVLDAGDVSIANIAALTGNHGPAYRPVVLPMGDPGLLSRMNRASSAVQDGMLADYQSRYEQRLTFGGGPHAGQRARAASYDAYRATTAVWPQLDSLSSALSGGPSLHLTASKTDTYNLTTQAIRVAAYLLDSVDARYVCVVDPGVRGHFDTHDTAAVGHSERHSANLWAIAYTLRDILDNNPSFLNDTIVVIHSEFGRAYYSTRAPGTEHWYHGYPMALIGGPFNTHGVVGQFDNSGPSGVGSAVGKLDLSGLGLGSAEDPLHPADVRAALVAAAGIDPFHQDIFRVEDTSIRTKLVSLSNPEAGALGIIRNQILAGA